MKYLLISLVFSLTFVAKAQKIAYTVSTPNPQTHYAEVQLKVDDWKDKVIQITMPSWAPGSYLMREFAKSVDYVTAFTSGKKSLDVKKIDKNTWEINTKGIKNITIEYPVYCNELSVRTSFVDASHAYFNATSLLMYIEGKKNLSGKVTFKKHNDFKKITTALPKGSSDEEFVFVNYDQLADCPIEIGNHEIFTFESAGVLHTVAMYGEGNYDIPTLQTDMAKITKAATDVFGENPNKEYVFIIHNLTVGSGGLEHINSTTLQVNRWTYDGNDYLGFLSLVAHEYFHLWNVKRIRPEALGPFKYDEENYTEYLWVMEGFTSYYDELLLYRAGFYDEEKYLNKLFGTINYVEGLPGKEVQSLAHSSFDAWIKAYRSNENSSNTTISYYSKGSIIAAMIDLSIIKESNGTKKLDHLLQDLYTNIYKETGKGFTDKEFKTILSKYISNTDQFFENYIDGTAEIPYKDYFNPLGLTVKSIASDAPYLGIYVTDQSGNWIIQSVRRNGSAYIGGLNANDEILAIDGWRYSQSTLNLILESKSIGDNITFIISRDQKIMTIELELQSNNYSKHNITDITSNELFQFWLN